MSDQDDALLDEDLGDEEYDLGNDEEEALLADDYEIDRQNNYKGEEETDDVLDLGVTDALDDLEGEDENVEYRNETVSHNQSHIYNDDSVNCHGTYYEQEEHVSYIEESIHDPSIQQNPSQIPLGDLREKLQKNNVNSQRIAGNGGGPGTEDDECEEARERRNRFQPERTIIPPKMNLKIPDSLENVVTMEHARPPAFRGRGRGRGVRGIRGGRFPTQGNYNPRFSGRNPYEDQNPQFRPPLIENRPPLFPTGLPMMNHQMINPQMYHPGHQQPPPPPRFQQYPQNHPPHGPPGGQHFPEPGVRPAFNQFQGMPGPRIPAPRMDYHPRPPGPRFNGPPNQLPYMQPQPPHYSGPRVPLEGPPLHHHEQMSANHVGIHQQRPMGPPQGPPMHPGHQMHLQERPNGMMPPSFPRAPGPAQGPPIPHHPGSQPRQNFENRPPFQEQSFDGRNVYEMKPSFNNPPGVNQFNSGPGPAGQQPATPVIPNVPLPPGHKILINPHFRGNPQPPLDAIGRPWDNSQSQTPSDSFGQSSNPAYQDSYNQPPVSQASQDYQKNYPQTKSDDPYAYFSDVWQENKTSKKSSISPLKSLGESNYSRDSNYRDYDNKYKSDSRDKYEEPRYRERTPPRSRDYSPKSRPHHSDSYSDHSRKPADSNRTQSRTPHKRTPEPTDKSREISPKRFKSTNRNSQDTESNNFVKNTREEDVDPEMREYRKKMEEQKRLREKLLQEKENRRKKAALEKIDETKDQKTTDNIQDIKDVSALAGVKKVSSENPGQVPVKRTRTAAGNTQATEGGEKTNVRIVRTVQATEKKSADKNVRETAENITDAQKKVLTQTNTRRIVIQKPTASVQRVVASIQKTDSGVKAVSAAQKTGTPKKAVSGLLKKTAAVQKPAAAVKKVTAVEKSQATSNKTSPQKAPHKAVAVAQSPVSNQRTIAGNIRKVIVSTATANAKKVTASSQNNQRIVLQPNSTKPTTVIIENLAASTTEARIRSMCQGIGTLESIIMGDSTATIVFKTHSAAMVFHNKFQRKMIDLSMINVRLVSKTSVSNKPTNTAVKK
ncbi:serine/arginine repetitive matrix protein 2 [Microplitis demolitor]|uniref:serine/arginine repetitive matrix protein 2 n=1 Tax=Microplitis demolitor TaxID=69319 RepID=UPI00043FFE99|nr:serine/arginine repetitive matrix protein 2 [Microplitis demolitor]